jgi:hypothetical protein
VDVLCELDAIWGTSQNDVWAAGSAGTILHYDGAAWTPTPTGVQNTFYGLWGSGPNDVWAVSSTDVVLHGSGIQNGVATWEAVPSFRSLFAGPSLLGAVWGSSAGDVRLGGRAYTLVDPESGYYGTGNQFVKANDAEGAAVWRPVPGSPSIASIWGSSADDVWMTGDNSTYVSYERGMVLHGTPAEAGSDDGPFPDRLAWTAIDSQSTLALESIWGSGPNDVWAVGGRGTIRHLRAGDDRFQEVDSPTQQALHSVWGSGPNDIWAVGDGGTILHYDGRSFEASTAQFAIGRKPHLNAVWGSGPNDVWIVGDGVALHYTGAKAAMTGGHR